MAAERSLGSSPVRQDAGRPLGPLQSGWRRHCSGHTEAAVPIACVGHPDFMVGGVSVLWTATV